MHKVTVSFLNHQVYFLHFRFSVVLTAYSMFMGVSGFFFFTCFNGSSLTISNVVKTQLLKAVCNEVS